MWDTMKCRFWASSLHQAWLWGIARLLTPFDLLISLVSHHLKLAVSLFNFTEVMVFDLLVVSDMFRRFEILD